MAGREDRRFVSTVEPEAEAAVLIATTDEAKAREAIESNTEDYAEDQEHRGVTVTRDGAGSVAVFDGLVASGTRAGVRLAIDVAKSEREPLSASGRYRETIAELEAGRDPEGVRLCGPLDGFQRHGADR